MELHPANATVMGYDFVNYADYTSYPQGIVQKAGLDELGKFAYESSQDVFATMPKEWHNWFLSNQKQLDDYVNNRAAIAAGNMVRFNGTGSHPAVAVGGKISVSGNNIYSMAGEDYGSYTVTKVTHHIADNNSYANSFEAVPSSIQVPPTRIPPMPYCETQSAVVTDNNDPQGMGRIRVKFHWMNGGEKSPWMRVTVPHAGGGKGMFFMPERDEEVIVGFESDSPIKPFVIGTVYHQQQNNSFSTANNDVKAIQTKSGTQIIMNDAEGSVYVQDPSGNTWFMDGQGNISVNAPGDINISAGGNLNINVGQDMNTFVSNNHTQSVGQDSIVAIGQNNMISVGGGHSLFVSGDSMSNITGSLTEIIEGDVTSQVKKDRSEISGDDTNISSNGSINKHAANEVQNNSGEKSLNH